MDFIGDSIGVFLTLLFGVIALGGLIGLVVGIFEKEISLMGIGLMALLIAGTASYVWGTMTLEVIHNRHVAEAQAVVDANQEAAIDKDIKDMDDRRESERVADAADKAAHPCIEWNDPYAIGETMKDRICIKRKE